MMSFAYEFVQKRGCDQTPSTLGAYFIYEALGVVVLENYFSRDVKPCSWNGNKSTITFTCSKRVSWKHKIVASLVQSMFVYQRY